MDQGILGAIFKQKAAIPVLQLSPRTTVAFQHVTGTDFIRLDPRVALETYVYKTGLKVIDKQKAIYGIQDSMFNGQIEAFLTTGLTLYRGVPRWHKTWAAIKANDTIASLGTGPYPDFDTNSSVFVPFTADRGTGVRAAISRSGMGEKDHIEFVEGYSKTLTFPVGLLISMSASAKNTAVGFFNASEVQVKGPISTLRYFIDTAYHMGTPLSDIFGSRAAKSLSEEVEHYLKTGERNDLSSTMPDVPTIKDIQDYVSKHGGLIK